MVNLIYKKQYHRIALWYLLLALITVTASQAADVDYLGAGKAAAISVASVTTLLLGHKIQSFDSTKKSLLSGPLPLETSLQSLLGGRCGIGKRNFLDSKSGAVFTALFATAGLIGTNAAWPRDTRKKDMLQDIFLLGTGLVATLGVTDMAKGIVARERPLPRLHPELAANRTSSSFRFDHQSFFSGHTSSAFFSSIFLNKRVRATMRQELTTDEYRKYRWAPSVALIGWASFVGWSRIQAYRHYVSDVLAGAAVGYAMAELFFSFSNDDLPNASGSRNAPMFIQLNFTF